MSSVAPTYHQRVAKEKRELIVAAATVLFLEQGYDRTSLTRIAERSGVSRATLFKQFSTKRPCSMPSSPRSGQPQTP
ncbi:TetR/AcrR family transcriptional regulator [Kibdelosporangium persicum]|uniref:TetR/AcrR family transcriptional regulator n=1 Tax=Kibdelosporangium persicum TaxID=2698649 RepID=UPI001FE62B90|nr:helix-turn-helix domain-containing protein [Kibdelosporangium persicum]